MAELSFTQLLLNEMYSLHERAIVDSKKVPKMSQHIIFIYIFIYFLMLTAISEPPAELKLSVLKELIRVKLSL